MTTEREHPNLAPSTGEILGDGLRFRVLTVGKSGVGKTSLIKQAFKIESIQGSDKERGKCDINEELHAEQNRHFVLHDSQGFEPGETVNFNTVKDFLQKRLKATDIKDRLHAVWLCIRIPEAGGRLIERGEEELFQLDFGDVPVIIVFTQYDNLYNYTYFQLTRRNPSFSQLPDINEQRKRIEAETNAYFQRECVDKLKLLGERSKKLKWVKISTAPDYTHTLVELTQETEKLIRNYIAEAVWVAAAMAQRMDVEWKVTSSVEVGMKKYWKGLASGANFAGYNLRDCFNVIHQDIVSIWNFGDSHEILQSNTFKAKILDLIQELADPQPTSSNQETGLAANLGTIKNALDVVAPFGGPAAPIISSIGLSVLFAKWLFGIYSNTPGTVRALMGYIIDLTIILEGLFWIKLAQPNHPQIVEDDVNASYNLYSQSEQRVKVHRDIRTYVDGMNFIDAMHPDESHVEVARLIRAHRRNFIDETGLNSSKDPTVTRHKQTTSSNVSDQTGTGGDSSTKRSTTAMTPDSTKKQDSQPTETTKKGKIRKLFNFGKKS